MRDEITTGDEKIVLKGNAWTRWLCIKMAIIRDESEKEFASCMDRELVRLNSKRVVSSPGGPSMTDLGCPVVVHVRHSILFTKSLICLYFERVPGSAQWGVQNKYRFRVGHSLLRTPG